MEEKIAELKQKIEALTAINAELALWKQQYNSHKQSVNRMSSRLRKLCKKLTPTNEIVVEMQQLALEIKEQVKQFTS